MIKSCWLTFALLAPLLAGCGGSGSRDEDTERRTQWIAQQTTNNKFWVRDFLTRAGDSDLHDVVFYDGWFGPEYDAKTNSAWRWMGKHGVLRLRSRTEGVPVARDMVLKVFGWVSHELMPVRQLPLEFAVNGHIILRFEPPASAFELPIFVPRWLLEKSEWVDFSITVANIVVPAGDWRELGFATTGFHWAPAAAK